MLKADVSAYKFWSYIYEVHICADIVLGIFASAGFRDFFIAIRPLRLLFIQLDSMKWDQLIGLKKFKL